MKCSNCNNNSFYKLQNDYIKCKKCAKKYSLKKLAQEDIIQECFLNKLSALESAKLLNKNYKTVKSHYDKLRFFMANFSEEEYNLNIKDYKEYEEFYYFTLRSKNKKQKSIYEAINIMGFYSNEKIYTLLMPKLQYKIKNEDENFSKYLNWNKIHSQEHHKTPLYKFWFFLEEELKKYKGINEDNFFFYLKECEFRFNYTKEEQKKILENF